MFKTYTLRFKKLDWNKWYKNTMIFVSPLAVLYLVFVIANINLDGIQLADFIPNDVVIGAMSLYVLNVLLDFFKKFRATS